MANSSTLRQSCLNRQTGTSSGFGRRLAFAALARGDRVVATARSPSKLIDVVKSCDESWRENLRTIPLDVTEGRKSIEDKMSQAVGFWGRIDVLVNNAGKMRCGLTIL